MMANGQSPLSVFRGVPKTIQMNIIHIQKVFQS